MLTSVAYTPGRAPATQQQFVSVCLPHTIFTLYAKRLSVAAAAAVRARSSSRSGCVGCSALEPVSLLAISTSAKGLGIKDHEYSCHSTLQPHVCDLAQQCNKNYVTNLALC